MASAFVSPNVYIREIDASLYVSNLADTILGAVGTASWGPLNTPTLISTFQQYIQIFGNLSGKYTDASNVEYPFAHHPMAYAVMRYLRKGRRAYVVRVGATSGGDSLAYATGAIKNGASTVWNIQAKYQGTMGNSIALEVTTGTRKVTLSGTHTSTGTSLVGVSSNYTTEVVVGDTLYFGSEAVTVATVTDDTHITLGGTPATPASASVLKVGTKNLIVSQVFTDPNTAQTKKAPIENFDGLTMKRTDDNYWPKRIGSVQADGTVMNTQVSNFISILTASTSLPIAPVTLNTIPANGVSNLTGGKDGVLGISVSDFVGADTSHGLTTFQNTEAYNINIVAVPGAVAQLQVQIPVGDNQPKSGINLSNNIADLCATRGDCLGLIDPPFGASVDDVIKYHNADHYRPTGWSSDDSNASQMTSNYAALYYPWVSLYDDLNNQEVFCPPSGFAAEVVANTDFIAEPWFAPAGTNRGSLFNVIKAERVLTPGERDALYSSGNAVNPIATFIGNGILIWGQRTLQRTTTALDRVNVRRMLLMIRRLVANSIRQLVFEPNDPTMWRRFKLLVDPFLASIKARRGLVDYKIVMDESTNTSDIVENNTAVGKVYLKPQKTAEIIVVDFILTPQGAIFDENLQATLGA